MKDGIFQWGTFSGFRVFSGKRLGTGEGKLKEWVIELLNFLSPTLTKESNQAPVSFLVEENVFFLLFFF